MYGRSAAFWPRCLVASRSSPAKTSGSCYHVDNDRDADGSSHHQLQLILDVLGTPTIDEFYAITSKRSKEYIRQMPYVSPPATERGTGLHHLGQLQEKASL